MAISLVNSEEEKEEKEAKEDFLDLLVEADEPLFQVNLDGLADPSPQPVSPQPPSIGIQPISTDEVAPITSMKKQGPGRSSAVLEIVPQKQCRWDFFLSHKQSNAQDTIQSLRMILQERIPGASFWLDLEQDPTEKGMCHGICHSKDVLIYLTEGYTAAKYCQMEMAWAVQAGKNIILVQETDERHGKCSMDILIEKCPDELKHIFAENVAIPWFRDPEFRAVSVEKILRNRFAGETEITDTASSVGKPLMFKSQKTASEDSETHEVFHRSFVVFTAMCGIALPGAGKGTESLVSLGRFVMF
eukprot:TRINITY_DN29225_c0_g1_i2.p1 TRINITY_DN29225_c0_g1~~TRINITY_DN29225_c0_g1_i2.p1  ORF type:complete len:324 (+),score=69.46 TRINITY_DN29225_c0_g1_i2:69-974(+)